MSKTIRGIKGFRSDLTCRGFQFEIGGEYRHEGEVSACIGGFHFVPDDVHPLTVFQFYPPAGSRFCRVEGSGKTDIEADKIAVEMLTVGKEIGLSDLAQEAVDWVMARATPEGQVAVEDNGLATASGTRGAATASGYQGAATASGTRGAATASGDQGAATASGYQGAATASGYQGAATASGDQGAATASGTRGAATASGYQGAAIATGPDGRVRGDAHGIDLFAREFAREDGKWVRVSIACGTTGVDGIRAGVWYRCVSGKLVEASA